MAYVYILSIAYSDENGPNTLSVYNYIYFELAFLLLHIKKRPMGASYIFTIHLYFYRLVWEK